MTWGAYTTILSLAVIFVAPWAVIKFLDWFFGRNSW